MIKTAKKRSYKKKTIMFLGVDYGKRKIGLATADSKTKLAQPYKVVKVKTSKEIVDKVAMSIRKTKASKVVVGISEGKMGEETKLFVRGLLNEVKIPVVLHDETLSTKFAQVLSIKAGIKRKKRKKMEDAYAAAVMLQSYLDDL